MSYNFKNALSHKIRRIWEKIAVIDIGSNSVRLVVYDGLKRTPLPLFNEKVLSGLARGMNASGRLNEIGAASAERAIKRFVALARGMGVREVTALATSAVRDAKDGKKFTDNLRARYSLPVKIITGEEEARFSSIGILASIFDCQGVVGDLGGGSLELSYINSSNWPKKDASGGYASFPLGPLRLKAYNGKAQSFIDKSLKSWKGLKEWRGTNFYAVGGGFRALAKIHMERKKYPLKVLHNYEIDTKDFSETLKAIRNMSGTKLKSLSFLSENRLETLSYTALIAERIIAILNPQKFIFSVHGIREGYLFDRLDSQSKSEDPLITGASDLIEHISSDAKGAWTKFGYELYHWMSPIFMNESESQAKLRLAACILSRLAWYEHTEYRAEMAYRMVLDAALAGISHPERVFIATAVFHRYKANFENLNQLKPLSLLKPSLTAEAKLIGLATRLALSLSGGAPGILGKMTLSKQKNKLLLKCGGSSQNLIGEAVEKRFAKLAETLGLKAVIE